MSVRLCALLFLATRLDYVTFIWLLDVPLYLHGQVLKSVSPKNFSINKRSLYHLLCMQSNAKISHDVDLSVFTLPLH